MSMKTSYRNLDYAYGTAMQKLRNTIGLTQAGLAERLGVSLRTVAGWEAGRSYPRGAYLKELIALAVQQQAFSVGHEAEEIRVLWKMAHQKMWLDEHWLSALLDQQSCPQEHVSYSQLRVEPKPVEATTTTAQVTEQEPTDNEPAELRTLSDQSSLVRSLHLTGLDAVTCEPQGQSHEQLLEAGTTGAPPPLPDSPHPKTNKTRERRKWLMLILIALAILTIIGSAATFLFQVREQALKTAAPQTYPGYLSGNGTLAFFDPLSREAGSEWSSHSDESTGELCQFAGGAYHVSQPPKGYFKWCPTNGIFSNFAFEVQLTIALGDCGGITFRDSDNRNFYKFMICQDGTYRVSKYIDLSSSILQDSHSLAIRTGLDQQNKIAVVALNSTMIFYVNEQHIDQEQDSSYTSGKIALIAGPYDANNSHATDVAYSNARLWTL